MAISIEIEDVLTKALTPEHLEVVNDSHLHAGHAGDDGSGESHFSVFIVSDAFSGLSRVERHRMVNSILDKHLSKRPHALSMKVLAPGEGR